VMLIWVNVGTFVANSVKVFVLTILRLFAWDCFSAFVSVVYFGLMECPTAPKREHSRSADPRSIRPVTVPKRRKNSTFHDKDVKPHVARYRIGAQKKGIAKQ